MNFKIWLTSFFIFIFVGCEGSSTKNPSPAPIAKFGLDARPTLANLAFPSDNSQSSGYSLTRVFSNLAFSLPVGMVSPPDNSNQLFVYEKNGRVLVFDNVTTPTTSEFLHVGFGGFASDPNFMPLGDEGLLGMVFDPDYATNRYFYIYYSSYNANTIPKRKTLLVRYQRLINQNKADATTRQIVLEIAMPDIEQIHHGGTLVFGNDKTMYIAVGDGGPQGDPIQGAQNKAKLVGKILRIKPTATTPFYSIPTDNPFISAVNGISCGQNATTQVTNTFTCKEIWAVGLRNPWRMSLDLVDNNLWIGDVGYNSREEVDSIPAANGNTVTGGKNLGWRKYEGNNVLYLTDPLPLQADVTFPVMDYPRSGAGVITGNSVSGGIVYRGTLLPKLVGQYVFGDYGVGKTFRLDLSTVPPTPYFVGSSPGIVSFAEDQMKELYAVSIFGVIYKVTEAPATDPITFPSTLSSTGLFSDMTTLTPSTGVLEYEVNTPLWSDGAGKDRWMALPNNQKITFDAEGNWIFPKGTVLVKQFDIQTSDHGNRRLETRVMVYEDSGWSGYSYRWENTTNSLPQTEATLLTTSATDLLTVGGAPQVWTYPSRNDCFRCHTEASGHVLGLRTLQINRAHSFPLATDNQLRTWNHIGLFLSDIGDEKQYSAYAAIDDVNQPVNKRVASYFSANCSHCHQPLGGTPVSIDLRYNSSFLFSTLINKSPESSNLGISNAKIIAPNLPNSSVLYSRMNRTDSYRMPQLGSQKIDTKALDLIRTWILSY